VRSIRLQPRGHASLPCGRRVSRPILPPTPWPAFRNASDGDLKSIYAYLRSVPPVTNHVLDVQAVPPAVDVTAGTDDCVAAFAAQSATNNTTVEGVVMRTKIRLALTATAGVVTLSIAVLAVYVARTWDRSWDASCPPSTEARIPS
jgi:hypothetical protein